MLSPAQLPSSTQMVLVNAVSFRGRWRSTFPTERTIAATFTLDDGHAVHVPMHALVDARSAQQDGARWLELPYDTGIEGSAATQTEIKKMQSLPRIAVDRPFLFFVVHRPTGTPVLMGRVMNPASGN